jgi:hypothetical protein
VSCSLCCMRLAIYLWMPSVCLETTCLWESQLYSTMVIKSWIIVTSLAPLSCLSGQQHSMCTDVDVDVVLDVDVDVDVALVVDVDVALAVDVDVEVALVVDVEVALVVDVEVALGVDVEVALVVDVEAALVVDVDMMLAVVVVVVVACDGVNEAYYLGRHRSIPPSHRLRLKLTLV